MKLFLTTREVQEVRKALNLLTRVSGLAAFGVKLDLNSLASAYIKLQVALRRPTKKRKKGEN